MKTRQLGQTGVQVSAICLGCMFFGSRTDEKTAAYLLDQYVDSGGNFIDTANNYAFWLEGFVGGESETFLGRWMQERKIRQRMFLATKVGARRVRPGDGLESMEGLSAQAIETAVEDSLRRLRTDYIDLYYAHMDHRTDPLEETLAAFNRLISAGKVRHIGCSNMVAWRIERARHISHANGWAGYCCVQQRYSYLRPKPGANFGVQVAANDDLLDYCRANDDLTLVAYSPLLGGAYTRPESPLPEQYQGPDTEARLAALRQVAHEVDASLNQVVLAWQMQTTPAALPVIGASTGQQLAENLNALTVVLNQDQIERLNSAAG